MADFAWLAEEASEAVAASYEEVVQAFAASVLLEVPYDVVAFSEEDTADRGSEPASYEEGFAVGQEVDTRGQSLFGAEEEPFAVVRVEGTSTVEEFPVDSVASYYLTNSLITDCLTRY